MREVISTVYSFSELSETAKAAARNWYKNGNFQDSFWSESVIEDAKNVGKLMGFDIAKIYYSGFASQGDGAMLEGVFRGSEFQPGEVEKYAPQDKELHRIAGKIEDIINQFYSVYAKIKHSGHYYHKFCTEFDVSITDNTDNEIITPEASAAEKELIKLSRDLMKWIYQQLEKEYYYQNSDEVVDENIAANGYEFTSDGKIYVEFD